MSAKTSEKLVALQAGRMADAVRGFVSRALAPFEARLRALEGESPRVEASAEGPGNDVAAAEIMPTALRGVLERLDAQAKRIKALEARPALAYAGTWAHGTAGKAGFFYTDRGSIWYCRREGTLDRPGESDAYQLACKSGRDGRDAPR